MSLLCRHVIKLDGETSHRAESDTLNQRFPSTFFLFYSFFTAVVCSDCAANSPMLKMCKEASSQLDNIFKGVWTAVQRVWKLINKMAKEMKMKSHFCFPDFRLIRMSDIVLKLRPRVQIVVITFLHKVAAAPHHQLGAVILCFFFFFPQANQACWLTGSIFMLSRSEDSRDVFQ